MKIFIRIITIILIIGIGFKLYINKDIEETYPEIELSQNVKNITPPIGNRNVTISGVDYLQSQVPIGNYGGELVVSVLGDPKTFNPCTSKDATSSSMAGLMFDGLLTTNPHTGNVEPLLA